MLEVAGLHGVVRHVQHKQVDGRLGGAQLGHTEPEQRHIGLNTLNKIKIDRIRCAHKETDVTARSSPASAGLCSPSREADRLAPPTSLRGPMWARSLPPDRLLPAWGPTGFVWALGSVPLAFVA